MNYYYDILLNFQDVYCMFYEWDSTDSIDFVKKIPLFHVDNKVYKDILGLLLILSASAFAAFR